MRARQIPKKVRDAVAERSGGVCEVRYACDGAQAVQQHHRRPRGIGGSRDPHTNLPSNLLHLCLACHRYIEGNRLHALATGWLVPQGKDPHEVSVALHHGRWRLDDEDPWFLQIPYEEWRRMRACQEKNGAFPGLVAARLWCDAHAPHLSPYRCDYCGQWHLTSQGAA